MPKTSQAKSPLPFSAVAKSKVTSLVNNVVCSLKVQPMTSKFLTATLQIFQVKKVQAQQ